MKKYELIVENVVNAYILDKEENKIVALCSTKRPDLGFEKLKELVEKANEYDTLKETNLKLFNDMKKVMEVPHFVNQENVKLKLQNRELTELIARNLVAWDTSKDKREGLLPEVYLSNKVMYKQLTGEEYVLSKAIKRFNIL